MTTIESPATAWPPRIEVKAYELSGMFRDARLWRRENSLARTATPVPWDHEAKHEHVIEIEVFVPDSSGLIGIIPVTFTAPCPVHPESPEAAPYWRGLVHRAALHEADEALVDLYDEGRPFNPHSAPQHQRQVVRHLRMMFGQGQ